MNTQNIKRIPSDIRPRSLFVKSLSVQSIYQSGLFLFALVDHVHSLLAGRVKSADGFESSRIRVGWIESSGSSSGCASAPFIE